VAAFTQWDTDKNAKQKWAQFLRVNPGITAPEKTNKLP
jgi:hypothetical protein